MNYHILKQIVNHFSAYKKITKARRVSAKIIALELASSANRRTLLIDLSRENSSIYEGEIYPQIFSSPFDEQLKKALLNAQIISSQISAQNRLWRVQFERVGAYKRERGAFVVEFLGRRLNFILLSEHGTIVSALSYSQSHGVTLGAQYLEPAGREITDKLVALSDVDEFLRAEFERIKQRSIDDFKRQKAAQLAKRAGKFERILSGLASAGELAASSQALYARAELLKANLWRISPSERHFELDGERFELAHMPARELQNIFKTAKKLAAKAAGIRREEENLRGKISAVQAEICALQNCCCEALMRQIWAKKPAKAKQAANEHIARFELPGASVFVGLNEGANAALLSSAKKSDWWFHLAGEPGAHVIVRSAKKALDIDVIYQAAVLAAAFSGKRDGVFTVDFTQRSRLLRDGGAHVSYNDFDSIKVFLGTAAADENRPRAR